MTASAAQQGIAERQIAFRVQNERIQATADSATMLGKIPFVCECADAACTEIVRLNFDEYEAVRRDPRRFFNVSGHEAPAVAAGAETIVLVDRELTMVVKVGVAGELAADANERVTD
jgi:hypothetical protein